MSLFIQYKFPLKGCFIELAVDGGLFHFSKWKLGRTIHSVGWVAISYLMLNKMCVLCILCSQFFHKSNTIEELRE